MLLGESIESGTLLDSAVMSEDFRRLCRNTITRNTYDNICYYGLAWPINIRKDIPKSGSRGVKEQMK